jgi:multicomponent Na+:H+ antiporter subunit E
LRLSVLALLGAATWLILAGPHDAASWIIGVPAVIAATWARHRLVRRGSAPISLSGALGFAPFFIVESFKGGVDVALRVLGPRVKVEPGLFEYRLRLAVPAARVIFADVVSLLPGTLSADIHGNVVSVHALDRRVDPIPELMRLERKVAAIFRETLPESGDPAT